MITGVLKDYEITISSNYFLKAFWLLEIKISSKCFFLSPSTVFIVGKCTSLQLNAIFKHISSFFVKLEPVKQSKELA